MRIPTLHPSQRAHETAVDFMRRIVRCLDDEDEDIMSKLPSIEAVIEFFDLWHTYDTEFWTGIIEAITNGHDHIAAESFAKKYSLPVSYLNDVANAVADRSSSSGGTR